MAKPIMNLDEVEFDDIEKNGLYTSSRGPISDHIEAKKLGYNLTVLPPGKVQCPFHCHQGEEEMFLIIDGAPPVIVHPKIVLNGTPPPDVEALVLGPLRDNASTS